MIDLHCHILPGIDDGAADIADSIAMARQAAADGIEAICATPHIRHDHDVRIEELGPRVRELNGVLEEEGVSVRLLAGGEVAETAVAGLDKEELRQVALGDGSWILLEPAPGPLSDSLDEAVADLAARGYGSVVAHPERHLGEDIAERLARLIRRGTLVQATAEFLIREDTASGMVSLADRGLLHVLGSDAHSSRFGRPARISEAVLRMTELTRLRPHLEWIARDGPRAIVSGQPVKPPYQPD